MPTTASSSASPPNAGEQPRAHAGGVERRADRLGHRPDVRHRQVRLELLDLAPERRRQRPGRHRRAHVERHAGLVVLRQRQVGDRRARSSASDPYLLSRTMPTISRHGPLGPVDADALADRARVGEVHAGRGRVDDDDRRRLLARPRLSKSRPWSRRMPSVSKKRGPTTFALMTRRVARRPRRRPRTARGRGRRRAPFDVHAEDAAAAAQHRDARDAGRLDARQALDALDDLLVERASLRAGVAQQVDAAAAP